MISITLAPQQETALSAINKWYASKEKNSFVLNGYAGTGKTTLAQLFPDLVAKTADTNAVIFCAFTGKAALQLRKKGCANAVTLHKLLYSPMEKDRKKLLELSQILREELVQSPLGNSTKALSLKNEIHLERRRVATPSWQRKVGHIDNNVKLIVVDESSMCDSQIYNDLISLNKPIIFLGDPFQLPPVFGISPIMQQAPDFVLTDVHRQSLDSPILRAATALRNGEYPSVHDNNEQFKIISNQKATYEIYAEADQVLCGRNKTRRALNNKMRRKLVESGSIALSTLPIAKGDKVVFLRNDYDEGVFNGTTGIVTSVIDSDNGIEDSLIIDADADDKIYSYDIWAGVINDREASEAPRKMQLVDHALALTVHKSQGSEWNNVCVHSEPVGHGQDARRWLYTAITRAQDKCTVVTRHES